jgi:DNA-binding beta-propeller fold protein YncE
VALALLCTSLAVGGAGCAAKRITADPVYFPAPPAQAHAVHLKSFNALDELITPKRGWLDALRGGFASPFAGKPGGIAYRDGRLYICDIERNVVHEWDLATGKARRFGESDDDRLRKPVDVAVSADGSIYVADTDRSAIVVFRADGASLQVRPDRETYRPVAVAIHGDTLYVADVAAHVVDVFSTTDAGPVNSLDTGSGGRLYYPSGAATDQSGRLYVSDTFNARVQVFNADRQPAHSFGQPGNRYGDMGKPRHLDVGPDGVVYIADAEFRHVHLFDNQGRLLMLLGSDDGKVGGTPLPIGAAIAASVPDAIAALVPANFDAHYYLFVTNSVGDKRMSLYAIGLGR